MTAADATLSMMLADLTRRANGRENVVTPAELAMLADALLDASAGKLDWMASASRNIQRRMMHCDTATVWAGRLWVRWDDRKTTATYRGKSWFRHLVWLDSPSDHRAVVLTPDGGTPRDDIGVWDSGPYTGGGRPGWYECDDESCFLTLADLGQRRSLVLSHRVELPF